MTTGSTSELSLAQIPAGRPAWAFSTSFSIILSRLTFRVSGEIDSTTGMVIDLGLLDRILDVEVRQRFDHRNINVDVPEFGEGKLVPTGENLARFIFERVAAAVGVGARGVRLVRVTVAEDATLSAGYEEAEQR